MEYFTWSFVARALTFLVVGGFFLAVLLVYVLRELRRPPRNPGGGPWN